MRALFLVLALRGDLLVTLPRRLRAPQQQGAIVAEPPLTEAPSLVAANRQRLGSLTFPLLGRSFADLRGEARQVAVTVAQEYLRQAGEPYPERGHASLLLAGHQPELFHPGVWVKNFALHGLAERVGATPLNLIVDNDTAKASSLRLPMLPRDADPWPQLQTLSYDRWTGEVPYEERTVNDEPLFASFAERAAPFSKDWGFQPLLPRFWQEVCRQAARTPLLGERFVAARRFWERRWGCHNLELPVSRLCQTEPFAWFACDLLSEAARFQEVYNRCVLAYRRLYGIRSRNHPVPELVRESAWFEVPFWAWRAGQQHRGRLMVQRTEQALRLRVGADAWPDLPLPTPAEPAVLIRAWQELERRGLKVRSRALTNTLFARLLLADLFLHGIGGGKYDELTDAILRDFYRCEPPSYLVLSATLLLPFRTFPARPTECRRLARELRDTYYNPQRHLSPHQLASDDGKDDGQAERRNARALAAQKQAWIAQQPTSPAARRERFQTLRRLSENLRGYVNNQLSELEARRQRCEQELEANVILERRDYAFCLYPEALLREFCTAFLHSN